MHGSSLGCSVPIQFPHNMVWEAASDGLPARVSSNHMGEIDGVLTLAPAIVAFRE